MTYKHYIRTAITITIVILLIASLVIAFPKQASGGEQTLLTTIVYAAIALGIAHLILLIWYLGKRRS